MKRINLKWCIALLSVWTCMGLYSCGDDSEGNDDSEFNTMNKVLSGTKWTTQNWDYDVADDMSWGYYFSEVYNLYFYSDSEGCAYYSRKSNDSDYGKSRETRVCFFTYNVEGDRVILSPINEECPNFSHCYNLNNGNLSNVDMKKSNVDSDDIDWINSISGTTGSCKWYHNMGSTLTIDGKGDMANYTSFSQTPWGKSEYLVFNSLIIKEGIKSIGDYAFATPNLGEVLFLGDKTLEKIGNSAFAGSCIGEIDLSSPIREIGTSAFSGCNYLRTSLPTDIEIVGDGAFANCKSASLTLTKKLRMIGNFAFYGTEIKSWTDSEVLEYIGEAAFDNLNVSKINLPLVKELNPMSFYASKVNEIHVGNSLSKVTGTPFYCAKSGTFYINKANPLRLDYSIVDEECIKNWILHVPDGSEEVYRKAEYWKNFKSIVGDKTLSDSGTDDDNNDGDSEEDNTIMTISATPNIFSAELHGCINGKADKAGFIYNTSSDFSSTGYYLSGDVSLKDVSGDYSINIEHVQRILLSNTKYYYRAYAEINGKKQYGEVLSFTTEDSYKPSGLTYSIAGKTFDMVLVSGGANGDFYIMQTELPISFDIKINGEKIAYLDASGDGIVIKSEFSRFLRDLRQRTGIEFRLPTSTEWQFAAKGGLKSKGYKFAGSNNLSDVGWYTNNSDKHLHDVALKNSNELGLYDMSGNYAELTSDNRTDFCYVDGDFYGGCFKDTESNCRVDSYKKGSITGYIPGTTIKEKNAFDGRFITIRLVYSRE